MAISDKVRERLTKLFALLGSNNAGEREAARCKIEELLAKNKKTWNDLTELLATGNAQDWQDDEPQNNESDGTTASARPVHPASLDLIRHILDRHLSLTEHQLVAVTLWIAHTFLFSRFAVTPRLIFESPVRGCGKTTGLNLIKALGFKTVKTDHITAAVTFRLIDRDRPTLLIDEADNQDLPTNAVLRAVINSGHHCDGRTMRCLKGEIVEFRTFAPLAFATISKLPLPILHRSVVIHMERSRSELERFDPKTNLKQAQDCIIVYRETLSWAQQCELSLDPPMPEGLRNRPADNWRVLLSIADACSRAWGTAAREAALALGKHQDEDLAVLLLSDIRDIFDRHPTADRLASAVIVADLIDLPYGLWSEWRGPHDNQMPRKLSQGELARMLSPFGIRPKTIWPPRRGTRDRSAKGYLRKQFEAAWASYCDGTPSQPSNVRHLDLTGSERA
jgi:hypothetical protein